MQIYFYTTAKTNDDIITCQSIGESMAMFVSAMRTMRLQVINSH